MRGWGTIVFMLLAIHAYSQENYELQAGYGRGFILEHSPAISHLTHTHPSSFWLSFYNQTTGKKTWHSRYNFPKAGATLFYLDYHNPILGKSIALVPNYCFNLGDPETPLHGYFKIGLGPAIHTNPYDRIENNKNNVVSTLFSYGVMLQSGLDWQMSRRLNLRTAISFTHFSNGSVKKPNKGINIVSIQPGVTYRVNREKPVYKVDSSKVEYSSKWQVTGTLGTGISETVKIRTGSYPFFNLQLAAEKRISYKSRLGFGVEYFHTLSLKEEIKNDIWLAEDENPDFRRVAALISHELLFGDLAVVKQLGYYVYRPYEVFEPIYFRLGMRYRVTDHMFMGLAVKAHYFKAESTEWIIGFRY